MTNRTYCSSSAHVIYAPGKIHDKILHAYATRHARLLICDGPDGADGFPGRAHDEWCVVQRVRDAADVCVGLSAGPAVQLPRGDQLDLAEHAVLR